MSPKVVSTETYDLFTCNGKFDEVLYKPEVTKKIITPYISSSVVKRTVRFATAAFSPRGYTRNTFSLINPLTAFSQVFKPKPYLNAGGKYIFSSSLRTPEIGKNIFIYFFAAYGGRGTKSLYTTSSKPKGKSDDFFQKVYSDKSANNPFFIVNNFFKQYPNPGLAKANLDYKLINTILCNQTSWHRPLQHRRTASSYEGAGVIRKKIGVSVRGIKTYSTNAITIDPLMLDFFTSQIQEYSEETIVIKLPDGHKLTISREFIE
jgi:hypothetical protein